MTAGSAAQPYPGIVPQTPPRRSLLAFQLDLFTTIFLWSSNIPESAIFALNFDPFEHLLSHHHLSKALQRVAASRNTRISANQAEAPRIFRRRQRGPSYASVW